MSATPFEVQEALRGRARERRVEIMDRSGVSHEEASVMAALDVAVVEIVGLTQRAEAAEAAVEAVREQRDYWAIAAHKLADAMKVDDAMVERAWKYLEIIAIEKSYGMLSGIDKEYLRNALTAALAVQPSTGTNT